MTRLAPSPDYRATYGAPKSLEDLSKHHILAAEGQLTWRLSNASQDLTCRGLSAIKTNSSEMVRELALAGAGIALRSLWDVSSEMASGRLVRVLPEYKGSHDAAIYAVHPVKIRTSIATQSMIDHLQRFFSANDLPRSAHSPTTCSTPWKTCWDLTDTP